MGQSLQPLRLVLNYSDNFSTDGAFVWLQLLRCSSLLMMINALGSPKFFRFSKYSIIEQYPTPSLLIGAKLPRPLLVLLFWGVHIYFLVFVLLLDNMLFFYVQKCHDTFSSLGFVDVTLGKVHCGCSVHCLLIYMHVDVCDCVYMNSRYYTCVFYLV